MDTRKKPDNMDRFAFLLACVEDEIDDYVMSVIYKQINKHTSPYTHPRIGVFGVYRMVLDISTLPEDEKEYLPYEFVSETSGCSWEARLETEDLEAANKEIVYIITDIGG